jgi:hydroxypyruvate reductase
MTEVVARVRSAIEEAFRRGLAAVDPAAAVKAQLEAFDIEGPVTVIAIGKAARSMAQGAIEILEDQVVGGVVVSPDPPDGPGSSRLRCLQGGHPIPSVASLEAGRTVMAEAAEAEGTMLVLISGGASALAEVPADGVTLADLAATYSVLLRAGLPIEDMNTVRRHLSALKNGGLLAATSAPTVTLLIADVVGTDFTTVGSGPTLPDASTPADALGIVAEAGILGLLPPAVLAALRTTPHPPPSPASHRWAIATDGTSAVRAAAEFLRTTGFSTEVDPNPLIGDAAEQGRRVALEAPPSLITVRHGETVVTVRGDSPGGRNQHAALAAALALDGRVAVFGALASDGRDGLTEAAGAIVDGGTCQRIRAAGLDPEEALAGCRSHDALAASRDLVVTGPTGTNVADIWMAWREPTTIEGGYTFTST